MTFAPYGMHLPLFCSFSEKPSTDRLERVVERYMDRADAVLMANNATQAQYDAWCKALNRWAQSYE